MRRHRNKHVAGTYLRYCDRSGFLGRRSEMVKEPDTGFIVLPEFFVKENPHSKPQKPIIEKSIRIE